MSVLAALQDMMSVPELTVPVQFGDASARGLFDQAGTEIPLGRAEIQISGPVLFVAKGALPALDVEVEILVGELGAASAASGRRYQVHQINPVQDGLVLACQIGGGR